MKSTKNNIFYFFIFGSGIALEYFDFIIFALLAPYIGVVFFPEDSTTLQLIQTFMIFAAGYFARPFSGLILGLISDKYGRKNALVTSSTLMAISTASIGLLPGFDVLGVLAPLLLVFFRVIQGICHGSEKPIAITYISELFNNKRGFLISLAYTAASIGAIASLLFCYILEYSLPESEIIEFAWRLPFLLGGSLAIIGILIRLYAIESPSFDRLVAPSSLEAMQYIRKNIFTIAVGICITLPVAFLVVLGLFMPTAMFKYYDYPNDIAYQLSLIGMCYYTICLPLFGYIILDKHRNKVYRTGLWLMLIIAFEIFLFDFGKYYYALSFILTVKTILALLGATYPIILASLYDTRYRNTSISISYNFAFALAAIVPSVIIKSSEFGNYFASTLFIIIVLFFVAGQVMHRKAKTMLLHR